jgi:cell division transport system permease protein
MAKIMYALRETVTNLARNATLAVATILCVGISLALLGSAWVTRLGVENAAARFADDVEFIIFLDPDATTAQEQSVRASLEENPLVATFTFFDREQAFEEFKELFADSPDLVSSVTPEILPPSFRVKPTELDTSAIREVGEGYELVPGVLRVSFADEAVERVKRLSDKLSVGMFLAAGVLLLAALFLILNTILVAIRSRRRDIEVMKLVGASNWFVRVPFMLEGLIQCLLGAAIAVGATVWLANALENEFASDDLPLLAGFSISGSEVFTTSIWLVVVAMVIGAVGSFIAVTRYLDV